MGKNTTSVDSERIKGVDNGKPDSSAELSAKNQIIERLTTGRYRLYYDYIEWLGLSDESNIIVLSPNNHYYYDDEEMKDVRVVLNLKHLNHIKEVKGFLYTVNHALARSSYMVGSFIDRRHQYGFFSNSTYPDGNLQEGIDPVENGISSRIPLLNMIYDFIDSRTNNRNMTSKSVRLLLEITGFKVLDMTEINGITCFCAQKVTPS